MPMTLYNGDLSPFTARVRMQIRVKGLENEIAITPRPEGDAYKALSPTGKVPCLDTGSSFHLPESETIAEFIEDSFPEKPMRGHTALSKAKVRLVSRYVDTYLMAGLGILFGQAGANPRDAAKVAEGVAGVKNAMALIEGVIEGPRYAFENRSTLADCALVPALFFCNVIGPMVGQDFYAETPKLKTYIAKIVAEDAQAGRIVQEMGAALAAFQSGR